MDFSVTGGLSEIGSQNLRAIGQNFVLSGRVSFQGMTE